MNPSLVAASSTQAPAQPAQPAAIETRPEVDPSIVAATKEWWNKTDNQVQRANALWEYREANKALFPARFTVTDPRRGQTPYELRNGKDDRRVRTPYLYTRTLQTTAMTVPEDFDFEFEPEEQVQPPQGPMMGMPTPMSADPNLSVFASTLTITMRRMLKEAKFVPRLKAAVQDSDTFPVGVLKFTFRRDYLSSTLNPNPGDKDESDAVARMQALAKQFASGEITKNDAAYQELLQLMRSLKERARITRWYGMEIQLVPMDAFGMSEEATDSVDVYQTPFMWHDALKTGEELLAAHPFRQGDDGATYGILESELTAATPWDTTNASTDPNARNRASRNKQLTAPRATPLNSVSTSGTTGVDPKKRQYVVREIWSKRDRTVYVMVRGLDHFIDKFVPQKTSERWYPFAVFAPRRVPTEVYGASTVELGRDTQARIHRKRTDEEKARFLSLPRGIYNRSAGVDEKEMVKLQDIPPGQLKGINFGTTAQKIDDLVQWWSYEFTPLNFDTTKDEQDLDQVSSLPVQSLGQTGSANFATEVSVASAGSTIAANDRKGYFKREIEEMIMCMAQVLLQELSADEVVRIAGPYSFWPAIYDEVEAQQIVEDAKMRAMEASAPTVLQEVAAQIASGIMPDEQGVRAAMERAAQPVWESEMQARFGGSEPMTRESMFQRLKVEVRSTFNSRLDKQQNIAMFGQLATACAGIGQAAQGLGTPFDMRSVILHHADLLGGKQVVDKAFPSISPLMLAKQLAIAALQNAQAEQGKPKPGSGPPDQQGPRGSEVEPAEQAQNALQSAPAPMG